MTKPCSVLIPIRYGDIDAQGHVNNARYLTFIEHARMVYLQELGLWDGNDFMALGLIVADAHVSYRTPILLGQTVRACVWVIRMGNKSLDFQYRLEDANRGEVFAEAHTVMVAYDYHHLRSIPIPEDWRVKIAAFEGIPPRSG
ncbi:MAG: thioesterase family protein [Anaerolineaceae bacterium]|nr:thioesterase family protein [Anaerolineaceae bacterium]